MRKIATLALAAALSIAALAPAAFAKPAACDGKAFADGIQQGQAEGLRGQDKKAWASSNCGGTIVTPPVDCSPITGC